MIVMQSLLMGRNGSGKSSSGEKRFKQKKRDEAEVCEEDRQIGEKRVCVIDCPGLLDPDLNKEKLEIKELLQKIKGMRMENRGTFIKRSGSMDKLINLSGEDPDEIDEIPERKVQIHLALLGKTGCGESASNTIIGRNVFESTASTVYQTKPMVRIGREISVIDTPGLYLHETHLSEFG